MTARTGDERVNLELCEKLEGDGKFLHERLDAVGRKWTDIAVIEE